MIDRWTAAEAVHGLGNELTSILCLAEMAQEGDQEAEERLVDDILERSPMIRANLDTLVAFVSKRRMSPQHGWDRVRDFAASPRTQHPAH